MTEPKKNTKTAALEAKKAKLQAELDAKLKTARAQIKALEAQIQQADAPKPLTDSQAVALAKVIHKRFPKITGRDLVLGAVARAVAQIEAGKLTLDELAQAAK